MCISAIDLGTNTLRVLILDSESKTVFKKNFYLFLGSQIVNEELSLEGIEKIKAVLFELKTIYGKLGVSKIYAVATAFARKIKNAFVLKELFKEILSCELNVIDGYTEGQIVARAISERFEINNFLVIDMGGGSTEFTFKKGDSVDVDSLGIGSLSLKNAFFKHYPPTNEEKNILFKFVIENLANIKVNFNNIKHVYGVGGTITTIAFLLSGLKLYDAERINGFVINRERLEDFCHKIEFLNMEKLIEIFPIEKGREEVLFSGCLFLLSIMHYFNLKTIIASDVSLLEGIIPFYN
jgi:exopolyphosphatase/guanosine-5'-triphosphate,3'-diphosphate pyrophosphatase